MTTLSLDVTNKDSIQEAKLEVEKITGGKLDILVNNAFVSLSLSLFPALRVHRLILGCANRGRNCTMPALDVDINDARACFETNFFSIITITQTFTPLLISSKGLILNIGSIAAIIPYVFGSVYNASKAAIHAFSNTLRLELEPFGVRVLVVVTGGVKSRIARTERVLPVGSLYIDIKDDFGRRVKHSQEGAMLAETYAKGVVSEALKPQWRQKKWMWRGNKTALIWLVWNFLGSWAFDMVVPRMFGLDRLRKIVQGRAFGKAK